MEFCKNVRLGIIAFLIVYVIDIHYGKWKLAVEKAMGWQYPETREADDCAGNSVSNPQDTLQRVLPGVIYVSSSLLFLLLSKFIM